MGGARLQHGSGKSNVATGVPVLDHLLGELARAGRFDLALEIEPDDPEAEIDAAGSAFGLALAPLLAAGGYGSAAVPAAEALALVALEVSGQSLVASNVDLTGVGGLGSDLAKRFLDSLAAACGLTLHVRLIEGEDSDHVLSSMFKSLGAALGQACARA